MKIKIIISKKSFWFPWKRWPYWICFKFFSTFCSHGSHVIWCFKLITVIVDICMCIMSEGNLNQNKNNFYINFVTKKYYFYNHSLFNVP